MEPPKQCGGSGKFIRNPGSWFLPIPDLGSKNSNKREGWKKICCHNFLCSHKFHKITNYFCFEVLKKKIWTNFQRIIEVFTQKIVTKLSKIWIWDPGSGTREKPIPDPGSRGQKGTGSRIRIRNTALKVTSYFVLILGAGYGISKKLRILIRRFWMQHFWKNIRCRLRSFYNF